MEIAQADQGGFGLARSRLLPEDGREVGRAAQQYVQHVTNMFELLGEAPDKAAADAKTRDEDRDRAGQGLDGPGGAPRSEQDLSQDDEAELQALGPAFAWKVYFADVGAPPVHQPERGRP